MGNVLKSKAAFRLEAAILATVASFFAAISASAQPTANSQLLAPTAVGPQETFSASEMSTVLASMGIASEPLPQEMPNTSNLLAVTEGGGRFVITLFDCADAANGTGCLGAATYSAMSNAGLAYDDLNTFNKTSSITKAVNVPEQNVVIFGVQRFFKGGVTRASIDYEWRLFLTDMQTFINTRNAALSTVSLSARSKKKTGKTNNDLAGSSSVEALPTMRISNAAAINAAIGNTDGVTFAID